MTANSLKRSFYLMVVSWHYIIIFFLCVSYFLFSFLKTRFFSLFLNILFSGKRIICHSIPSFCNNFIPVMCCLLQLIICGIMNQFFGFLDRTHLFENQEISSYEGFNVMPRRIPDFPDSFHSWNFLSSIGSGITFLSFAMFCYLFCSSPIISFIFWNSFAILWFIIWNLLCFVLYSLFSSETCLLAEFKKLIWNLGEDLSSWKTLLSSLELSFLGSVSPSRSYPLGSNLRRI